MLGFVLLPNLLAPKVRTQQPSGCWGTAAAWLIATAWLTETGLSDQPRKQNLAACVLYFTSRALAPRISPQLAGFGRSCSCFHFANGETEAGIGLEL